MYAINFIPKCQNPHRHRVPGKRIEADTIGYLPDVAQAIGIPPGEHRLQHDHGLIQVILRGNRFGNRLTIFGFGREVCHVDEGLEERQERIGIGPGELLRDRKGAADSAIRLALPFPRQIRYVLS